MLCLLFYTNKKVSLSIWEEKLIIKMKNMNELSRKEANALINHMVELEGCLEKGEYEGIADGKTLDKGIDKLINRSEGMSIE